MVSDAQHLRSLIEPSRGGAAQGSGCGVEAHASISHPLRRARRREQTVAPEIDRLLDKGLRYDDHHPRTPPGLAQGARSQGRKLRALEAVDAQQVPAYGM